MRHFSVSLVPCTRSPVFRDMHRQTKHFLAENLQHAAQQVAAAFPGGSDLSGEWFVEADTLRETPAENIG